MASPATEETLIELLNALKGNSSKVADLAKKAGVNVDASKLSKFATEAGVAGDNVSKLSSTANKAGMVVGSVLGDLASSAVKTGGNLVGLSQQLIEGSDKMSDFFNAFRDLPIVGIVAGLFSELAKIQEVNIEAYRKLSDVGVNFGGSLTEVRRSALRVGLTLDEYTAAITKNSAILATAGTVQQGVNRFNEIQARLMKNTGSELMALGYTTADLADATASYLKLQGTMNKQELQNTDKVTRGVELYAKELDMLSKLTGMQRKDLQKQLEEASFEASWQNFTAGLTPEKAAEVSSALSRAIATGGKPAAEAFKAMMMGLPPLTEASQLYIAASGANLKATKSYVDLINNTSIPSDQKRSKMNDIMARQIFEASGDMKQFETVLRAGGLQGSALNSALQDLQRTAAQNTKDGRQMTVEEIRQRIAAAMKQQEISNSEAKAAAEAQLELKRLGEYLYTALVPVLKMLTPVFSQIISGFTSFVKSIDMKVLGEGLASVGTAVANFIKDLLSQEGRDKIKNDLVYYFRTMMIDIRKSLGFITAEEAATAIERLDQQKKLYDTIAEEKRKELEAGASKKEEKKSGEEKKSEEIQPAQVVTSPKILESLLMLQQLKDEEKLRQQIEADRAAKKGMQIGGAVGMLGGAVAGQLYIPIPGVGALIGATLGALGGGFTGYKGGEILGGFDTGTLGKTGKLFNNFGSGTQTTLHGTEAVVTPQQMNDIIKEASGGDSKDELLTQISTLTAINSEMMRIMKESSETNKRILDATRSLNGNLFV